MADVFDVVYDVCIVTELVGGERFMGALAVV